MKIGNQYWILILIMVDAYFTKFPQDFTYLIILCISILIHDDKFKKIKLSSKEFWLSLLMSMLLVILCTGLDWYFVGRANAELAGSLFFLSRIFLVKENKQSLTESFLLIETQLKEVQEDIEKLKG